MSKTMSIYAEALINNREYKSARINGEAVGVANARNWSALIKALRIPAYTVYKCRYDNMANSADVVADQSELYAALRPIVELIGEVNGMSINARTIAEIVISNSTRIRTIDTSIEMAHARSKYKTAKRLADDEPTEDNIADMEKWHDDVKNLESLPGNCKRIVEIQVESTFIRNVEIALGDAITAQTLRDPADILAEIQAKKAERAAKRKANKQAKNAAK